MDIKRERLFSQKIITSDFKEPKEVISWMGAIQAQDYAGAKWSVGLRILGGKEKDVEKSLQENKIVRLWLMRGTLHFAAVEDIRWLLQLFSARIIKSCGRRYKELELDDETLQKTNKIIENTLLIHPKLKRSELLQIINQNGISTKGQRAAYILQRASYDGIVCQEYLYKNEPVYVLQSKLKDPVSLSREEALTELAKRYFTSRGPATLHDFAWWSGLPLSEARLGLNGMNLQKEIIRDQIYWFSNSLSGTMVQSSPVIHLLPGFDEFLLGYKERSASLDPAHLNFWCPGGNGMFYPIIVADGKIIGTWKNNKKNKEVTVETSFFQPPDKTIQELVNKAAEDYKRYLNGN